MTVTGETRRVDAVPKVTGRARYAYEYPDEGEVYAWVVTSAIARGRVVAVDADHVTQADDVLAVIWHQNAARLEDAGDATLAVLQSPEISHRGEPVALVVATTPEAALEAARTLPVRYEELTHDVLLEEDHPTLYRPEVVNPNYPADSEKGDPDGAWADCPIGVDEVYRTAAAHNNPMEPHATVAFWDGEKLTLFDSNQGGHGVRDQVATLFGLDHSAVQVVNPYVGGGFGSKGTARPNVVLAAMAARLTGRTVKLGLTRQQMFSLVGYRTPTIQRVRLGADADGRLRSITHEVVEQTGTLKEFAEQTAVPTRMMYAAPHRRTTHRLARLDVPVPSWMRAPGECPGFFAFESALDELAVTAGLDPVELRILNEPDVDPEQGVPFSSRNLVACLREGARRFGWAERDPRPGVRRDGEWLVGSGVSSSTYPAYLMPASARAQVSPDGRYTVSINATDLGTGARTVLRQVAAETLEVPEDAVDVWIGDTDLPEAGLAGGSMGTSSWGTAVAKACRRLRERLEEEPGGELSVQVSTLDDVRGRPQLSRHAFGAQFAEVRVSTVTGEVRVPRMVGVFAAGRILNARTARSQFIGGMTMGLGMALHEEGVMDAAFGDYANHDFAGYHIPSCADVGSIEVSWIHEEDPDLNAIGTKGIGEIGIVGTAAAIANAVHHATGIRLRSVPIHPEHVLERL